MQDPNPEIRGWQTRQDRRRHGSPQLVPGCRHQLGQVPLHLLLSSAGGQTRQGKTSGRGGEGVAANGCVRRDSVDLEDKFCTCRLSCQRVQVTPTAASSSCVTYTSGRACFPIIPPNHSMHAKPKPPNDVAAKTGIWSWTMGSARLVGVPLSADSRSVLHLLVVSRQLLQITTAGEP